MVTVLPNRAFDYATLHQNGGETKNWFWESMSSSYKENKVPDVLHRPFDWVLPESVEKQTNYKYSMFCVAYGKESSLLPLVNDYGK